MAEVNDIERTKKLWERWNLGLAIHSDADLDFLAKQYATFVELHRIFDPRPNLYSTLDSLERAQRARKGR